MLICQLFVAARKIGLSPAMTCMLNWTFICFQPAKSDHIWLDSWSTNHWWHVLNSVHIFYTLQIVQSLLSKCSFNKTIFVRLVTISMYSLTCRKCHVRGIFWYLLLLSGGEQSMCHFFVWHCWIPLTAWINHVIYNKGWKSIFTRIHSYRSSLKITFFYITLEGSFSPDYRARLISHPKFRYLGF